MKYLLIYNDTTMSYSHTYKYKASLSMGFDDLILDNK